MMPVYFWDTYAFYRLIEGGTNYLPYTKGSILITTKWNLTELHYILLSRFGKDTADKYYDELIKFVIDIEDEIIKKANIFRLAFKNRDLSYIDCIGYTIAKSRGIKFLTGDQQFQDLDNVEFVK